METVYPVSPTIDIPNNIKNKEVEKHANVKCIKKNNEMQYGYVCFHYTLEKFVKRISKNSGLPGYLNCCEDGYDILSDYFKQIPVEQARMRDIITYHEISDFASKYEKPCAGNCMHFAVISKTDGTIDNTVIRSKWGKDGVFKGKLNDVPNEYGTAIVIWRKL